jgi:hypothetical protein
MRILYGRRAAQLLCAYEPPPFCGSLNRLVVVRAVTAKPTTKRVGIIREKADAACTVMRH